MKESGDFYECYALIGRKSIPNVNKYKLLTYYIMYLGIESSPELSQH